MFIDSLITSPLPPFEGAENCRAGKNPVVSAPSNGAGGACTTFYRHLTPAGVKPVLLCLIVRCLVRWSQSFLSRLSYTSVTIVYAGNANHPPKTTVTMRFPQQRVPRASRHVL